MIQKREKLQKNNYYRRKKIMARTENEITRDEQQTNLLLAIISELKEINKNIKFNMEN